MAFSFGTSGSTPQNALRSVLGGSPVAAGGTPASKALSIASMAAPPLKSASPAVQTTTPAVSAPKPVDFSQVAQTAGLIPKSQTITNTDGSSHTTTYHPPQAAASGTPAVTSATPQPLASQNVTLPSGAVLDKSGNVITPAPQNSSSQVFPGQQTDMTVSKSPPSTDTNPYLEPLANISQNGDFTSEEQGLLQQGRSIVSKLGPALATITNTPGIQGAQDARAANLTSSVGSELQGIEGLLSGANNAQSTLQGGLNNAGQLATPSNAFTQVSPGNIAINSSGQPVASAPSYQPIGQTVAVSPTPNLPGGTAGEATPYTIKSGDTFSALASSLGTTTAAIEAANPGVDPNNLQPGQQINVPSSTASSTGSPFQAGVVAGEQSAGQSVAAMNVALGQARGIQSQIGALLQQQPNLNQSPLAAANAIQQWAQSTQAPTGPYVSLLQDLQEYANTIAPVLGVGGTATDLKTSIATNMVPTLAAGGTIQQALANLDNTAVGKINSAIKAGQNAGSPVQNQPQASAGSSNSGAGTISTNYGTINPNL